MKLTGLGLAAMLALTGAAPALATEQAQAGPSADEAPKQMESVVVTARRFHIEPLQFKDYEYAYNLSNGDVVRFSRRVGRFYASINTGATVEIFASAPDVFVSKGGAKLVFTENGDKLTIDRFEELQIAASLPVAVTPKAPK
jgi:hypothetical protein